MSTFQINEIFHSLQGEGFNTGRPVTFVRLANCNLGCVWCDTRFHTYDVMDLAEIINTVNAFPAKSVIITGGEPTINENLFELVRVLKDEGYWLALETNGVKDLPATTKGLFDYIVASPKSFYSKLYENPASVSEANEVRIVVDGNVIDFCKFIEQKIKADYYYLSPRCGIDDKFNVLETIEVLGKLNMREEGKKWGLSFQTHKLANIQ